MVYTQHYGPIRHYNLSLQTFLYLHHKYSAMITQKMISMNMKPNTDTAVAVTHTPSHPTGEKQLCI